LTELATAEPLQVISDNRSSQKFKEGRFPTALLADDRSIVIERTMSALGH
jgi:hypothetical protein